MSTHYEHIGKAPVQYVDVNGEIKKTHLVAINDVHISNSFDIPFVRGAVGLFNAIISRFMYFATYDANNRERQYQKAQEYVYFPAWQIVPMINRCESQVYNIEASLERILNIRIKRANEQHGANTFRLSDRAIELLHIFTPGKLDEFIKKYQISEYDQYTLRQIYNYRVVRPSDKNMDRQEREEFHRFIKSRRHRNFLHFCAQNNKTPQARVLEIEAHIDLLSPKQLEQLQRIKTFLKEGITKLANYFHWKLIDIQQFVSMMLLKRKNKRSESNRDSEQTHSPVINRNKTEGEQRITEEIAAVHLKDPEEPSIQDIAHVGTFWNIMAHGNPFMETMDALTKKRMESIYNLVKSKGKNDVLKAIENTGNLYNSYKTTMRFEQFMKDQRFNKILEHDHFDTRLPAINEMYIKNKAIKFWTNYTPVSYDNVPEFNSKDDAKSWFKSHLNQM